MIFRRSQIRRGLSLLEVILAFTIFMLGFAGISQLMILGHGQSLDATQTLTASRLAEGKMAEIEAGIQSAATGGTGSFEEAPEWQWEQIVEETSATNVYEVTVRVWNNANVRQEVRLTQHVFDASAMGSAAAATPPTTETP